MEGPHGIKETKELVTGAFGLGALLYARFKDGVQTEDIVVILDKIKNDPELAAALVAAYNGANEVPHEVKDLSVGESIELAGHVLAEGLKVIQAVK